MIRGLSRAGVLARAALTAGLAVAVVAGTVNADDRTWPFAPMTMFAFSVDRDGEIHSRTLEAVTVSGRVVEVPLGRGGVGLERAEIEGQVEGLVRHPNRLQGIAVAAKARLPDQERYAVVRLLDEVSQLRDGRVVSRRTEVLSTWRVVDPADPKDLP